MKKLLLLVMMTLGLSVSTLTVQAAEVSGTVGYSSDYFWRGISQNNGVAVPSLELGVEHEGWYAGAMAIPVDFGTSDSLRYDLYTGYNTSLTDKLSMGGGVMQYRHANGIDKATEYYFGGQYSDILSVMYYVDKDDTDATYLDMSVKVPYVSIVDLHLNYGKHKDGNDVKGLTVSKKVTENVVLSLMVMDEARHGKFMDGAALGIHYNF